MMIIELLVNFLIFEDTPLNFVTVTIDGIGVVLFGRIYLHEMR